MGESSWTFIIVSTLLSCAIQALFGWWAMMKAEETGSSKIAAFIMGFLFLYLGVRMVPILRRDRIFATPIVPRTLPPRPKNAQAAQPYGPPTGTPAAVAKPDLEKCPACGSPSKPGRKLCMICGAPMATG
jgi:hypothetical protein